jgi:hypothetical protein
MLLILMLSHCTISLLTYLCVVTFTVSTQAVDLNFDLMPVRCDMCYLEKVVSASTLYNNLLYAVTRQRTMHLEDCADSCLIVFIRHLCVSY